MAFKRLCVCSINEVRAKNGSGSGQVFMCSACHQLIGMSPPPPKNRPKKGEIHWIYVIRPLHLERHLPPFAQCTLVRLAHPLNVREAAPVTRCHEAMVQHLYIPERQQRWHVVIPYVQCGRKPHERAIASSERHP